SRGIVVWQKLHGTPSFLENIGMAAAFGAFPKIAAMTALNIIAALNLKACAVIVSPLSALFFRTSRNDVSIRSSPRAARELCMYSAKSIVGFCGARSKWETFSGTCTNCAGTSVTDLQGERLASRTFGSQTLFPRPNAINFRQNPEIS